MLTRPTTTWFLRLGALTLLTGLIAGIFELTATQAPYTPLHFGILAAPFAQLRSTSLWLSLFAFVAAWLRPHLAQEREPWALFGLYAVGALLSLGAMAFAASQGMLAIQIFDPRPGAGWLALTRLVGQGLVALAALDLCRRLLWPKRSQILQQGQDDAEAAEEEHEQRKGRRPAC